MKEEIIVEIDQDYENLVIGRINVNIEDHTQTDFDIIELAEDHPLLKGKEWSWRWYNGDAMKPYIVIIEISQTE